jgi:uncharacterized protein YndB with AHSA1/START domain
MAEVTGIIAASPDVVYDVLADGWLYSNWVVGTSHMRAVETNWPETGSRLHHCSGVWPVVTRDETVVEQCEPGHRLQLAAKGGMLGAARVTIVLDEHSGGTRVTMTETPVAGLGKWLHNPVNDALLTRRNAEALARLAAISERRTVPSD